MDNKTNQELFKQALVEGVNRRIDREIADCDEEITYSRRHIKNMARIVKGKELKKPLNRKMIAILVAAAILLLAGCAIIYRNEIREFVTDVREFFVKISFSEGENDIQNIEEIYELTYLPEGYELESQIIGHQLIQYIFIDSEGHKLKFIQQSLDSSSFSVDIEHGNYDVINIDEYEIYYRQINTGYCYIWNDGNYAMQLYVANKLPEQTLTLLINGINTK